MKQLIIAMCACVLMVSCHPCRYYPASSESHPRVKTGRVVISVEAVPSDVKPMGQIICRINREHKAYKKARKLAGKHGANTLYLVQSKEISSGQKAFNALVWPVNKSRYNFVAVHR